MALTGAGRCVLSDFDGTLVDSAEAQAWAWGQWAEGHGIDPALVIGVHGVSAEDKIRLFAPDADVRAEAARMRDLELTRAEQVTALPGARQLLTCGRPVAIVSSGDERLVRARLRAAGLPAPDVLVTADMIARGKPDPLGYVYAASLLRTRPEHCDVLEDAPVGVAAGRAAGCDVYAVTTSCTAEELQGARAVFPDVAAYLGCFRSATM